MTKIAEMFFTKEKPVHALLRTRNRGVAMKINIIKGKTKVAMLKYIIFLGLALLSSTLTVQAVTVQRTTQGTASRISHTAQAGTPGVVTISAPGARVANSALWLPDANNRNHRLIIDLAGATIDRPGTLPVNSGGVLQVRFSQFSPALSRFVIDLTIRPGFEIIRHQDRIEIRLTNSAAGTGATAHEAGTPASPGLTPVAPTPIPTPKPTQTPVTTPGPSPSPSPRPSPSPTPGPAAGSSPAQAAPSGTTGPAVSAARSNISISMSGNASIVRLEGINLPELVAQGRATILDRPREKLVQITLNTLDTRFRAGAIAGNNVVHGVLVSHSDLRNTTTIRLSGRTALAHSLESAGNATVIRAFSQSAAAGAQPGIVTNPPAVVAPPAVSQPPGSVLPPSVAQPPAPGLNSGSSVSRGNPRNTPVQITATADSLVLTSDNVTGSRVFRLGSDIVIDMPGVTAPGIRNVGSTLLRSVAASSSNGHIRLILSTEVFADWTVIETGGRLEVRLASTGIQSLTGGDDANIAFRIRSDGIAARFRAAAAQVIIDDDIRSGSFTFSFPLSIVNLGNGEAKTNDTLSNKIMALSSAQSSFLLIERRNTNTLFSIVEEADGNGLIIRRSEREAPQPVQSGSGRLVVLDAGHGGIDPGAVFEGVFESHVNLDITLRAEAILRQRGVNVLLTRNSDTSLTQENRAAIANSANAAVFVSIHHNSMPAGFRGPMTLYFPTSVNGRAFAQIMQNNLVSALNLGSIGLRSSSQLIVLRRTRMPAILAELAVMSDPNDMAVIKTEAYRQAAANAIAQAVSEILATMNTN